MNARAVRLVEAATRRTSVGWAAVYSLGLLAIVGACVRASNDIARAILLALAAWGGANVTLIWLVAMRGKPLLPR
jgi:hypothetical protein